MDTKDRKDKPHRTGAGILVLAKDTGRFLAMKRSDHVQHGRTWGLTGGLAEPGESPRETAEREFREETDYKEPFSEIVQLTTYADDKLTYSNFIAVVEHEFQPRIDHENEAFRWVESLDDWPKPAHFGIEFLKKDADCLRIIREKQSANDNGTQADARARRKYAPTLYHVFHGSVDASELLPDQSRGDIRATPNLREALPKLIARKDRLATVQLPDSEEFVVIVQDRENFLQHGKLEGVIFQLQSAAFKKIFKGRYAASSPQPLSDRNYFDHIEKMEAVMYYGLHILFTPGPATEETRALIEQAVAVPDFPARLKALVKDGTLVYENAQRGMNVSPLLQPEDAPPPPKGPNPRSLIHFGKH